jgi:hypothetical protein
MNVRKAGKPQEDPKTSRHPSKNRCSIRPLSLIICPQKTLLTASLDRLFWVATIGIEQKKRGLFKVSIVA